MPIYTYKCEDCSHEFDKLQKMSDEQVKVCELCSGPVKRVFHPVGIIFKGSGFYSTDYANKKRKDDSKTTGAKPVADDKSKQSTDSKTKPKDKATPKKEVKG